MTIVISDRLRLAELTSGVGAVVLGIGLGVLASDYVGRFGLPLLLIGGAAHGWGMFDKHRLERETTVPHVWWDPLAYWTCWGLLAALTLMIAAQATEMI